MAQQKGNKTVYELNISPELFEAWGKLKRKKDSETIATKYGFSRPVIDRALNFGYVKLPEVIVRINDFFAERKEEESKMAKKLTS